MRRLIDIMVEMMSSCRSLSCIMFTMSSRLYYLGTSALLIYEIRLTSCDLGLTIIHASIFGWVPSAV